MEETHLERDVVGREHDLELLPADDVLLGPVGVILPARTDGESARALTSEPDRRPRTKVDFERRKDALDDLRLCDDALELVEDGL